MVNLSSNKRLRASRLRDRVQDDLAIATIDDAIVRNILHDNCESSSFTRHDDTGGRRGRACVCFEYEEDILQLGW